MRLVAIILFAICAYAAAEDNYEIRIGPSFGKWGTSWHKDTFDGSISNWAASQVKGETIFTFGCEKGECRLTVVSRNLLDATMDALIAAAADNSVTLTMLAKFRIDDEPVIENYGFYLPTIASGKSLDYIVEHMRAGKRVRIRTEWKSQVNTFAFDLKGFKEAMDWVLLRYDLEWDVEAKAIRQAAVIRTPAHKVISN